jgi:hypothetical protein
VDPQSWNRYSYRRNNPINRVDLLGLEDEGVPIKLSVTAPFWNPDEEAIKQGIIGTGGRRLIHLFTEGEPRKGDPGQSISELWDRFWNELNKCEKKVALAHATAFQAVYDARRTAEEVESDLRGGKEGDDDYPNAVKHCVWSCVMTIKLDFSTAKAFGDAHESDPKNDCNLYTDPSSLMDQHNNDVGRTIGYNLGSSGSPKECIKRCKASGDLQNKP